LNWSPVYPAGMDRQQVLAIILVALMIGSSVAYGAALIL
jgi:hypothetical protein